MLTPALVAVLDCSKLSDRKATFVIAETAKSLGHDITDFCIKLLCRIHIGVDGIAHVL